MFTVILRGAYSGCVPLGKLLYLAKPQLILLYSEDSFIHLTSIYQMPAICRHHCQYIWLLGGSNERMNECKALRTVTVNNGYYYLLRIYYAQANAIYFGQELNLCLPPFFLFAKGDSCLVGFFWGLNEVMYIKCLEPCPACIKCYISIRCYYLSFSVTTWRGKSYYHRFKDELTQAQGGKVNWPRSKAGKLQIGIPTCLDLKPIFAFPTER